jgi:hypothetical protein
MNQASVWEVIDDVSDPSGGVRLFRSQELLTMSMFPFK